MSSARAFTRLTVVTVLVAALGAVGGPAGADGAPSPHAGYGPFVDHSVAHALSAPLAELSTTSPTAGPHHELPVGRHVHDPLSGPLAADPVVQTTQGTTASPSSTSFEGVSNLDSVIPPDTNGAIGRDNATGTEYYVQWVNLHFAVYNPSTGAAVVGPLKGSQIWANLGGVCATSNQGDPIAKYDPGTGRWLLSQFAFKTNIFGSPVAPYYQCVAVSTSGNPGGNYNLYAFTTKDSAGHDYFPDYPKFGSWPDGFYLSVNYFNGNTFAGPGVFAFNRDDLVNGVPSARVQHYDQYNSGGALSTAYGSLLPSDRDGRSDPPSGSPNYFAAVDTGAGNLQVWKFHVDWGTPTNSTLTGPTLLATSFNATFCGGTSSNCVPQPGTTRKLDTLNDRLMYRLAYRNFGDHESLVVNHTVNVASSGDHAAVRWYELRLANGVPSIYQQGSYAPDGDNRWMGSVAMDGSGDIAVGYSVSSGTTSPSIRYAAQTAGATLNTLDVQENTLQPGAGSQTGYSRWGDYSAMTVDPTDDCTFWYTNEYYSASASYQWQTRIGHFKLASCGQALTKPSAPQGLIAAAGDASVGLSWSAPSSTGGAAVSYNVYRGAASGGEGTTPFVTGLSTTSYTDKAVSNGTTYYYTVTAVNPTGESPASNEASATPTAPAPDFSLSATPASQSVTQGGTTSYSVTVTPLNGFVNSVGLTVSGCPASATCTFSPTSTTSTSTLTVATTSSTPTGSSTLTVTGSDGTISHTTSVGLVVNAPPQADFSLSATPPSQVVKRGSSVGYAVTVSPISGFTGSVGLTMSGCPSGAVCSFSPNPTPGMSTLTVATTRSTPLGTLTLTITGTSGGLTHSTSVTLQVKNK
jgi:hypothetical protein